jgi:hypothetical protein
VSQNEEHLVDDFDYNITHFAVFRNLVAPIVGEIQPLVKRVVVAS